MVAGKVNESLSRTLAFKGDDGLSDAERKAYDKCRHLSCLHEACYKRYMYSPPAKQKEKCGELMDNWKSCFAEKKAALLAKSPPLH